MVEIEDVGAAFRDYRDRESFDTDRLEEVEQRRAALDDLCLRYGADETAVLAERERMQAELASLERIDARARAGGAAVGANAEKAYVKAAKALGRCRRSAARALEPALLAQFGPLALGRARFEVRFSPARGDHVGGNGSGAPLHPRGAERAEFLLAANAGESFRALHRVASGGELSRVMLALHAVVEDALAGRVLVFDEVDTGVGGAVADAVGARLARLAERHQVLCITHLPQVAAYGDAHYVVGKRQVGQRTLADVRPLAREERVEELARMLAGKSPTRTSRRHACELLDAAGRAAPTEERVKRIAVYPGTFDPVTNGHLDLVDRGRRHFDRVIVAILRSELKQPLFELDERIGLLREAAGDWDNVEVDSFDGLLVDYAKRVGSTFILRGIRAASDFEYEMQMAMMNRKLSPELETVFLVPSEALSYVSSRLVREVARLGGSVDELVPPNVAVALARRFRAED